MEIMSNKNYRELLDYIPYIKSSLREWAFVDVRVADDTKRNFSVMGVANLIHSLFESREGKLYICNDHEILILLRWGQNCKPNEIAKDVEEYLPEGSCEVRAYEPTPEGISKFELLITCNKPMNMADIRRARKEKIALIADDDMYMRLLVRKGIETEFVVQEVVNGAEVLAAYKKYTPNILFLDVHLPNMEGTVLLRNILIFDPNAYVIMLSADSSRENVAYAINQGAAGFLAKPFTKEKLQKYVHKCPG